jgi:nucleotide-binding universal stress UspA family protein
MSHAMTNRARYLLPIDDSERTRRAVDYVARHGAGAEVTLLHVGPIPPELVEHPGAEDPEREERLEQRVAERSRQYDQELAEQMHEELFAAPKAKLSSLGLTVREKVITEPHPDPARAIVAEMEAGSYDEVILGREEAGRVKELFLPRDVAKNVDKKLDDDRVTIVD